MSMKGRMMGLAGNFKRTIEQIAGNNVRDIRGNVRGTQKYFGYVSAVHTGDVEDDSMKWTVDVAEYKYDPDFPDSGYYHEGCLITAIRNNVEGVMLVPSLGSEVIVEIDPETNEEYVTMFSHVDIINLNSHKKIRVGVVETADIDTTTDEGDDYDELQKTGKSSVTEYDPDEINNEVTDGTDTCEISQTAKKYSVNMSDNGGFEIGNDGIPHVNGDSKHLVLFEQLSSTLNSLCNALSALEVNTTTGMPVPTFPAAIEQVQSAISALKSEALLVGK